MKLEWAWSRSPSSLKLSAQASYLPRARGVWVGPSNDGTSVWALNGTWALSQTLRRKNNNYIMAIVTKLEMGDIKPSLRKQGNRPWEGSAMLLVPSGPQSGSGSPDCVPSASPGSSGHRAQSLASGLATRALGAGHPWPAWACPFPLAPSLLLSWPRGEPPAGAGLSVCPSDQPFLQPGRAELPGVAGTVSMGTLKSRSGVWPRWVSAVFVRADRELQDHPAQGGQVTVSVSALGWSCGGFMNGHLILNMLNKDQNTKEPSWNNDGWQQ